MANGIEKKFDYLKLFLSENSKHIHMFGLSETHTNDSVLDAELSVPGFLLERKDRHAGKSGGVSLYVRDDLQYQRRFDLEDVSLDFLWVEIFIKNSKSILVSSAYRPPDSSKYHNRKFSEKLDNMLSTVQNENKEIIISGDLNCNYGIANDHIEIKDIVKSHGLSQIIKLPTRIARQSQTIIDVIYTNNKSVVSKTLNHTNSLSDHNVIGVTRKLLMIIVCHCFPLDKEKRRQNFIRILIIVCHCFPLDKEKRRHNFIRIPIIVCHCFPLDKEKIRHNFIRILIVVVIVFPWTRRKEDTILSEY